MQTSKTMDACPVFVVMGVCGSGKTTVGQLLANRLGLDFVEGDAFHPPANVDAMRAGIALTDADRQGWLALLAVRIAQARQAGHGMVLSCSALKRSYRDVLRRAAPDLQLVYLAGEAALLAQRIAGRSGHYMPLSLLDSQFADLQPPQADEEASVFDVSLSPAQIVASLCARRTNASDTPQPGVDP